MTARELRTAIVAPDPRWDLRPGGPLPAPSPLNDLASGWLASGWLAAQVQRDPGAPREGADDKMRR